MKKTLSIVCLSGAVLVLCGILGVSTPTKASTIASENVTSITSDVSTRSIGGRFDALFRSPYDPRVYSAGTYKASEVKNGVLLNVNNGGPTQLQWSAAVINANTNQNLSGYIKFQHGSTRLYLPINKSNVKDGDRLVVQFVNDNFPTGVGFLQVFGTFSAY